MNKQDAIKWLKDKQKSVKQDNKGKFAKGGMRNHYVDPDDLAALVNDRVLEALKLARESALDEIGKISAAEWGDQTEALRAASRGIGIVEQMLTDPENQPHQFSAEDTTDAH